MAYFSPLPTADGRLLEQKLESLYLRRSVVDHVIQSLELYQRVQSGPKPSTFETREPAVSWLRELAS